MTRLSRITAALLLALLLLSACVNVPSDLLLQETGYRKAALDPANVSLTSWNIEKNNTGRWPAFAGNPALHERLTGVDLLLLQEACAEAADGTDRLTDLLRTSGYGWAQAVSFDSAWLGCGSHIATGVLSAARAAPLATVALRSRHREFGITPKTALASTFALSGRRETLLVINAHLLNFEWLGTDDLRDQLAGIEALVADHAGPVIFAGDFNTRNAKRMALIEQLAARRHLCPVFGAAPDRRTRSILGGRHALDHIYFRGLALLEPGLVGNESAAGLSDHNSLHAVFRVADRAGVSCSD